MCDRRRDVPGTVAAWHQTRLRSATERSIRLGVSHPPEDGHARVAHVAAQRTRGRPRGQGTRPQGGRESRRLRADGSRVAANSNRSKSVSGRRQRPDATAGNVPGEDRKIELT